MNREHWMAGPTGGEVLEAYLRRDGALIFKRRGNHLGTYAWLAKTADGAVLKRKGGAVRTFRTAEGAAKTIEALAPWPEEERRG